MSTLHYCATCVENKRTDLELAVTGSILAEYKANGGLIARPGSYRPALMSNRPTRPLTPWGAKPIKRRKP